MDTAEQWQQETHGTVLEMGKATVELINQWLQGNYAEWISALPDGQLLVPWRELGCIIRFDATRAFVVFTSSPPNMQVKVYDARSDRVKIHGTTRDGKPRLLAFDDPSVDREDAFSVIDSLFSLLMGLVGIVSITKNIEIREAPANRAERKRRAKGGLVKSIIVIKNHRGVTYTPISQLMGMGEGRRLHHVMGHFAHYGEENPLFGKVTGVFWIPPHYRGNREVGETLQTVRIKEGVSV